MRARTRRTPLDRVDLFRVSFQIVHARVLLHGPNFQCHVVRARGQQTALRVPFDGVHLVLMALERFYRTVVAEATHVYFLVRAARGKALVVLPVDV